MPVMTDGVYSEATAEEMDNLHQHLRTIDPTQEGVTLNKLRIFYPRTPWGSLIVTLRSLQTAGRARARQVGSPVPFEYWTWQ